jgi:hypothetical protein
MGFLIIYLNEAGVVGYPTRVIGGILALAGLVLGKWAYQEWIDLRKPDPEKPPSILK